MIGCRQQVLHGEAERTREPFEIVQADVGPGALERADVSAMQAAAFRQLRLRPPAHKAQEPQLARQLIPCLALHTAISGTAARAVYSAAIAKRWRYATICSAFVASLACVALTLTACAAVAPATPAGLPAAISGAVKDGCAVASDCAVMGIGARACGGPADYLVYSRIASDVPALTRAVTDYNAAQAATLRRRRVRSTCEVVPAPDVACVARRCVAESVRGHTAPLAPQ